MHKFWLTFTDKQIEEEYQLKTQYNRRWKTFTLVSLGFILVFMIKTVQAAIQKNNTNLIPSACILVYLILQLIYIKKWKSGLRVALVLLNHVVTIFFISYEERDDSQIAMLQGANQMAATYLIILIGEFFDGFITIINLSFFRIIWAVFFSTTIQYSAIVSAILLMLYINYFDFQIHKAIRSQYLLSQVDSHWEEVLKRLASRDQYLLLQFTEENLSFKIQQVNNCDKIFSHSQGANSFLSQALYNKIPLKTFLHSKVQRFVKDRRQTFCQTLIISYKKIAFKIEFSIYFSNQPNILLVFKDYYTKKVQISRADLFKQHCSLLKLFNKLMGKLVFIVKDNNKYLAIQRKIIILNLYQNYQFHKIEKINIQRFIQKITQLYPEVHIIKSIKVIDIDVTSLIDSIQNILALFLFSILEPQSGITYQLYIQYSSQNFIEIHFIGQYDIDSIKKYFAPVQNSLQLIFSSMQFKPNHITAFHKDSIDIPFRIK